jgi:four helix bundle protein
MTPDELSDRLLEFAARVGTVVDKLPDTRLGRHVAGQLVRCGTSAPPNYEEGCAAESRADFVHKLKIALKELRESRFWLRYIVRTKLLPGSKMNDIIDECQQLCNILGKSTVTAKGLGKDREKEEYESQPEIDAPESESDNARKNTND